MDERLTGPVLGCDIGNAFAYASVAESADSDPSDLMPGDYVGRGMPTRAFVPAEPDKPIQVCDLKLGAPGRLMKKNPNQVVEAVKRSFSQSSISLKAPGGTGELLRSVRPEDVYAAIVRDLVIMANSQRRERKLPPVYDLVFTYPVAFLGDTRVRERIEDSIESVTLDGHKLRVVGSLPEPAAAALDYLYYVRRIQPGPADQKTGELTVLVVDLGHGSLDLAVVTATDKAGERPYVVHPFRSSDAPLGGIDFDDALEAHIRELIRAGGWKKKLTETQIGSIREEARQTKHRLSEAESAQPDLEFIAEAGKTLPPITRADFEARTADLLGQILEQVEDVLAQGRSAGVKIDRIILTGGGSHMPMLRRGVEELVRGECPVEPYRPERAVSYGAARYAWGLIQAKKEEPTGEEEQTGQEKPGKGPSGPTGQSLIRQKANYMYGLRYVDPVRKEYRVRFLIPYGTPLPAKETVSWRSELVDLDLDLRRSRTGERTGMEAPLEDTVDLVNRTFHSAPTGDCTVTMELDEDHHVSVVCRFPDGKVLRHGTGKHREKGL